MEGFPVGLAVGMGSGIAVGISIGMAIRGQRPLTPEEERRRKKLVTAGVAIMVLGVIALALIAWLI